MVFAVATGAGVAILQYAGTSFAAGSEVVAIGAIAVGAVLLVVGLRYLLPSGTATFRTGVPAVVGLRGLVAGSFFAVESVVPLCIGFGGTLVAGAEHGVFSLSVAVSILAVVMAALALAGAMLLGRARSRDL